MAAKMDTAATQRESGIATRKQLERRLSSIALGRVRKPDIAKVSEQLKAIELLLKMSGTLEPEKREGPLEVKIRVLDSEGKEVNRDGDRGDAPAAGFYGGEGR